MAGDREGAAGSGDRSPILPQIASIQTLVFGTECDDVQLPEPFQIVHRSADASAYERPTLLHGRRVAQEHPHSFIFYLHTKGVTHSRQSASVGAWRRMLEHFLLDRAEEAVQFLKAAQLDACGANFSLQPRWHFSGNFWWARTEHVARCAETIGSGYRSEFEVMEGENYEAAYIYLQEAELDVLLLSLPIASGGVRECLELLDRLDGSEIDTLVIVLSSDEKKTTALKIIDGGSYDYYIKPIDPDVLRHLLERAVEKLRIQRENRILREEISRKSTSGDFIGSTDAMRHLFDSIKRIARATTNVIIRGESGVGKELVARAIHDQSPRRSRAFVSVNCAALPETLMESELFGYEKGAFTGAAGTKEGRIEVAHQGTLFLDEIATLTLPLQSKLLRVLEDRSLTRLGGKKSIKVDFRLISATNENLEEMTKEGRFREDLLSNPRRSGLRAGAAGARRGHSRIVRLLHQGLLRGERCGSQTSGGRCAARDEALRLAGQRPRTRKRRPENRRDDRIRHDFAGRPATGNRASQRTRR